MCRVCSSVGVKYPTELWGDIRTDCQPNDGRCTHYEILIIDYRVYGTVSIVGAVLFRVLPLN